MPVQIPMPKGARKYLEKRMLGERIGEMTVKKLLGIGNTAVTYEVDDSSGLSWALKLVARESYGDRAPFREVARFARVRDNRFLVFPERVDDWQLPEGTETIQFICFKSRCVRGEQLDSFLASERSFSAKVEIHRFIENMAVALHELKRIGFAHGDLHGRNIMREVIGEGGPLPETKYVIIDFSEAHPTEQAQEGLLGDLESLGNHLRSFFDAVYRRDVLTREDERVLKAIEHLPGLLNGMTADTVRLWDPIEILRTFQDALRSAEEAPKKLRTPFDSLSAENITNDELLARLCFTNNWWATELEKPGNVLLIGPRGCGKSMIFRRLRFKTKVAAKRAKEVKSDQYVGFYLPCESVFFNRISDLSDATVDRYGDALVLFFNMAVTSEVSSTLAILPDSLGPLTPRVTEALRQLMQDEIDGLSGQLKFPNTVIDVSDLAYQAERVMRWIRRAMAYGDPVPARGSKDYLAGLVDATKRLLPSLSSRLFVFFLDDYTEERVPLSLQRILHPIVLQRSGDLCFKISAHMFGSIYFSYPQPLALDEGRNINVINLGSEYINPKKKKAERAALITIMNGRFTECEEYEGPIERWLGHSTYPEGKSLNRALHEEHLRSKTKYNGIACLQQLCTGDISEMIRMVRDVFREASVRAGSPKLIAPTIQDKAIRSVSRDFLSRVRHIRPDGQKLYEVLSAFGTLSKQLLYERPLVGQGQDRRGKKRADPYDLLTIYVDDLTKANLAARQVWKRLQQASIFVNILLAPSQRMVIADRVTLRRIYCPAFATTLTSSEHLQLTKQQFEWFMDRPDEFCKDYARRNIDVVVEQSLWSEPQASSSEAAENSLGEVWPAPENPSDFTSETPEPFTQTVAHLPELCPVEVAIEQEAEFDMFIGAMGFEERTSEAIGALARRGIRARRAFLLEFDMYYDATEARREKYEAFLAQVTRDSRYRPINAPVSTHDPLLAKRLKDALKLVAPSSKPKVLFDCTSCPSLILSKCLGVLLEFPCELTVLYSEAGEYFPTREEWESGKLTRKGRQVEGPYSGVRYVERPSLLQSDDMGERPTLLVMFPTFNTERTSGVISELEPTRRIWLFGEPHDVEKNSYRILMAQFFAAPLIIPGDPWSQVSTFDYRHSMRVLAGIYARHRFEYSIVVMPHGSKMQTLGVSLFAATHQLSQAFAIAQNYDPRRYSKGCLQVWAVPLGDTQRLIEGLKLSRALPS